MNEAIIYASPSDWFGIGLRYTWQTTLTRYEVNINILRFPNLAQMHIIMAKPAGGPSKRDQHAGMDED
ncbi:TCP-1/cpn60 chaperonin family protein [Prunus dulcis]|uniref:TCP-1/cpn60 chaperonin family protein n=1 Tax=Prunus dulcis TaxID=3755 RepID=A0A4Y1RE86_PRUDU|nr:TCP-1/cpn60 chaperonin family protein [Prunus dulcis]